MTNETIPPEIEEATEKHRAHLSFGKPWGTSMINLAIESYVEGALSDAAREYWFKIFKEKE